MSEAKSRGNLCDLTSFSMGMAPLGILEKAQDRILIDSDIFEYLSGAKHRKMSEPVDIRFSGTVSK